MGGQDAFHGALTPAFSHPMGEGARRAGEADRIVHPNDASVGSAWRDAGSMLFGEARGGRALPWGPGAQT
jgi:hypothetical protein